MVVYEVCLSYIRDNRRKITSLCSDRDLDTGFPSRFAELALYNAALKHKLHNEIQDAFYTRHKVSSGLLLINSACTVLGLCLSFMSEREFVTFT